MARKRSRDLTMEQQLARGPVDLPFLMLVLMLLGIGLVMMFSASFATAYYDSSKSVQNNPLFYISRQGRYAIAGIVVMFLVSKINYQTLRGLSLPMVVGSVFLLGFIYTPLGVEINQVRRWLRLFLIAGPTFQPSEIAKVAVVIFFAARLSKRDTERKIGFSKRAFLGRVGANLEFLGVIELIPYAAVLAVTVLLVAFQTHMSGAILVMVGGAAVLFVSGINLFLFIAMGGAAFGLLAVMALNTGYMTRKLTIWLDPWSDPQGKGFQAIQSMLAIGSGGLTGVGLGNSRQKFNYLPEPENDFIFSVLVEELGFIGGAVVLILFALLILRGYWLALHARDKFGMLIVVGITTLLAAQVILNVGVVTNLFPNTGISLPFFSYGGTALVIQLAEMGIVLSVSRQIPAPKKD